MGRIGGEKTVKFLQQVFQQFLSATTREEREKLPDPETVIDALERIGTTSATEFLLEILPLNCYPENLVCSALSNIGTLNIIPHLWKIQLKSESPHFFDLIAHIQNYYQYYNPKYCNIIPQNIKINNFKNDFQYDYTRLSDYQWYC